MLWILLLACSGKEATPPPAIADPWATAPSTSAQSPLPPPRKVELVLDAPGREPRRPVAFARKPSKRDITFISVTDPGNHELRAELAVRWTCAAGGECHYELASFVVHTGSDKQSFSELAKDTRGDVSIQPDGSALIQPTTFMKTTPSLTELLKLAIVQLPRQPIGVGAVWHVTDDDSRRTYTVDAMTPAALKLRFAASYSGGSSTSAGELAVNLDDPLAVSYAITQESRLEAPGAKIDVTSSVTLRSQP